MCATCGWPEAPEETDDETILTRLLALNLERAAEEQAAANGSNPGPEPID